MRRAIVLLAGCLYLCSPATSSAGVWAEPIKLGPNVNGLGSNHSPFITADGTKLYLSAQSASINEDLFMCSWDSLNEEWGPRQLLPPQINTSERELSVCESPDGQYLWFIRYNGAQSFDLYFAIWDTVAGDWATPQNAGPTFNTACIEWSVSISPDGRRMFVDRGVRPGFIPCDLDVLWVSYWNDSTGWWDSVMYMGDYLNRSVRSASMSLDTSRIYFSSGSPYPGVPKYGSNEDLFVVTNNPPSWDSVDNVGMPVSTYDRETDVAISADGRYLYFSSDADTTRTQLDIYVAEWMPTGIVGSDTRPEAFSLTQPFPNPFNGTTSVLLTIAEATDIDVEVFNVLGGYVTTLLSQRLPAGTHHIRWASGAAASGLYFIRARADTNVQTRKVLLLK